MRHVFLALLLSLLFLPPCRADEAKALAPFLDEQTVAVLRLDLRKFDVVKLAELITPKAKPSKELAGFVEGLVKDGGGVLYVVASLADVPDEHPFLVVPLTDKTHIGSLTKRLGELKKLEPTLGVTRVGDALLVAGPKAIKRLRSLKPAARPDLLKALASGERLARLVVVPTADARRILDEMLPTLPDEIGGGSVKPLSRGLQWLSLDLDAAPKLGLTITAQSADAEAAQALGAMVGRALQRLVEDKVVAPDLAKLAALWKPKRDDSRLALSLDERTLVEWLRPHVEQYVVTEQQVRAAAQVRQLLKAMHDYEAKHGHFPAHCSHDKAGKPLLSWRVHLLPFLGEDALYREFKLDEPWDSDHNKKLAAQMPAVYRPASEKLAQRRRTTYVVPVGEATMFPPKRGVRIAEIADGTIHTVAVVDVEDEAAVGWTAPEDLRVSEKEPWRRLSLRHSRSALVGLADGNARFLPWKYPGFSVWGLLTRAGGEVVELP